MPILSIKQVQAPCALHPNCLSAQRGANPGKEAMHPVNETLADVAIENIIFEMTRQGPVLSLPDEVLDLILVDLPSEDLASLRLVARRFVPTTTALLFATIYISSLHRDRDNFLRIAATTHLAAVVRHVVWYELAQGPANTALYSAVPKPPEHACLSCELPYNGSTGIMRCHYAFRYEANFLGRVFRESRDLFWWNVPYPRYPSHALCSTLNEFNNAKVEFFPLFLESLSSMPKLVGMASKPMPFHRDMRLRGSNMYPYTPQLFHGSQRPRTWDWNLGLKFFLLPAMAHFSSLPTSPIVVRRLHIADETIDTVWPLLGEELRLSPKSLKTLTHLELRLSACAETRDEFGYNAMLQLLATAASLTHLTVSFERSASSCWDLDSFPHFPSLVSVDFTGAVEEAEDIVAFVRKHARTLRRVRLEGCFLAPEALRDLAAIPHLRLDRFVVLPYKGDVEMR
ncbi:hypothetical protein EV126DRAFT_70810 [Verticillium dahliae]|nr:Heat shock factor protein [Verticillium dahliae VDG2]KAH6696220.1 hypothetical protein EV126DRAFT_70810 [Verticillium dahliae]